MTKICIARLRSGINYVQPLEHIMDSFCELMKDFIKRNPQHEYYFYNFGYNQKPIRDLSQIERSDVIIIPSENEFVYHIKGRLHTNEVNKSNAHIAQIEPLLANKKIINLRSDRRDNEELYRITFPHVPFEYAEIDEDSFQPNIHVLKYYYIGRHSSLFEKHEKDIDFIYWGSDKRKGIDGKESGDQRHIVLNEIHKDPDIKGMYIGGFNKFKRDLPWQKFSNIIPYLNRSNTTLCFNWMDDRATTARYVEALGTGVIPLVWQDYDSTGKYNILPWQRVWTTEEALDRIKELRYHTNSNLLAVKMNFHEVISSEAEYSREFERRLLALL